MDYSFDGGAICTTPFACWVLSYAYAVRFHVSTCTQLVCVNPKSYGWIETPSEPAPQVRALRWDSIPFDRTYFHLGALVHLGIKKTLTCEPVAGR